MTTSRGWDEELQAGKKTLRTLPGALLLGPTGARLWADYLEPVPGFSGRFDFIHKMNIPLLYKVTNNLVTSFDPCETSWFPSYLHMQYNGRRLSFTEEKFISWDDCAVSCQTWTNNSEEALCLKLVTYREAFTQREGRLLYGGFSIETYSFDIDGVIVVSDEALFNEVLLKPGETKQFVISAAVGIRGVDPRELLAERAAAYANGPASGKAIVKKQQMAYDTWLAKAPRFNSSDPVLNKTWSYRWFVLRHNLADPKYGYLQNPLFYEGRSHKKSKSPFSKGGWEFSKLIPLSVPLHLMDARWYHDPAYGEGSLQNMKTSQDGDGLFCSLMVDEKMHSFANFSCWAAYEFFLVHRDIDFMKQMLPSLKMQITGWQRIYGNERDQLMTEFRHTRTGKEYQPSYWYFHNFPKNPKDPETYTYVKRVDRTVYHYLNALGVAKLCEELGDSEAGNYYEWAERIKKDVLEKMWDPSTQFFYDLHYQTDEKAFVKNIVGFYPAWAEIIGHDYDGMIDHLLNAKEFSTRCPFPTVSADSIAYAKEGGWFGQFIKGRNGCMWNGPTWPYTNSIVLDALARESKRRNHEFDPQFAHYLREYSFLHFQNRDLNQPSLVEHYNSDTGEPLSDEQEYNHSYYIDLVIRHVAGLTVHSDRLVLDPLEIGLDYFCLDQVKAAGLDLTITYRKPGSTSVPSAIEEGYRLFVNGKLVYSNKELGKTELFLKSLQQVKL